MTELATNYAQNVFLSGNGEDFSLHRDLLTQIKTFDGLKIAPGAQWLRLLVEALLRVRNARNGENDPEINRNISKMSVKNQNLIEDIVEERYGHNITSSLYALVDTYFSDLNDNEEDNESMQADMYQYECCTEGLHILGWDSYYKWTIINALVGTIKKKVAADCSGEYCDSFLSPMREWIAQHLHPFANKILGNVAVEAGIELGGIFDEALCSALARQRASELFEIVMDYPESIEAIQELKITTGVAKNLSYVGHTFRTTIQRRLLHLGATTSQILDMYVSMIKATRVIDSSDVLLNFVAAPIRRYLMSRKDTVRCIVESLIEGEGGDLHGELRRGGPLEYLPDSDDEDGGPGTSWQPRSRNAGLAENGSHGLDILALLVSIYGSTDIFVSEYRSIMAEKILSNAEFLYDHEVAILELLKIRFGEEPLQACEVMLRDLEESARVTGAIQSELSKRHQKEPGASPQQSENKETEKHPYDCVIVSDNYWPQLHSGDVKHHPMAEGLFTAYNDVYHDLKKPRKLHPMDLLGHVDLELDFEDGSSRTFVVKPLQATLILHMSDKRKASAEELSTLTQLWDEEEVRKQMGFWVGAHVCVESNEGGAIIYAIDEAQASWADADARSEGAQAHMEAESTVDTAAQEKAAMAIWQGYVRGMLRSHGSMPLERVHTMLRMMSSAGDVPFEMNIVELRGFLAQMDDIESVNNLYDLRK